MRRRDDRTMVLAMTTLACLAVVASLVCPAQHATIILEIAAGNAIRLDQEISRMRQDVRNGHDRADDAK